MTVSSVYNTAAWRELPRERCIVADLFGDAAGECRGLIHRHHVDPHDSRSRTIECCAGHHSKLHAVLRMLTRKPEWKRCTRHRHQYAIGRRECERRLNGLPPEHLKTAA